MSGALRGKKLALGLFLAGLLLAVWRFDAVGRRLDANSAAIEAERNLAVALRQFGGALPRRFLEDSLARLEKARGRDPASVEAAVSQAGYLFMLRRYEQAEKVYLEALALEERAEIYGNLARLYLQQDRPIDAVKPLNRAMRIDPQNAAVFQQLLDTALAAQAAKDAAAAAKEKGAAAGSAAKNDETAGLLFSDDFESGSLGRWSRAEGRSGKG